jgi:DNA primase
MLRPAHSLRIVRLPEGLDPDDLLKAKGRAAMEALLSDARPLVDVLWETEQAAMPLDTPEAKAGLKARLLAHVETIGHPDVASLYRRELLDRYGQIAFPSREERPFQPNRQKARTQLGNKRGFQPGPVPSDPEMLARLNRARDGARDALSAAVVAGLVRWPTEIHRHAEALMATHGLDPRFEVLVDCCDSAHPLESEALSAILSRNGLELPGPAAWSGLRFGFLQPDVDAPQAKSELAQAVELLLERPVLEAALARATQRLESEFSDEAFVEQQRLRQRKLEFDNRLRQMATRHAAGS